MSRGFAKGSFDWLQNLPEPTILLNRSLEIEALNDPALEFVTSPGATGQGLDAVLGEQSEKLLAGLHGLDPESPSTRMQVEIEGRFFRTSVQLLPDGGYLLLFFDITREQRREQFRNDILSMIAHDLRNPLGFLHMTMEMMTQTKINLPERTRAELLKDCHDETDRLLKMTEDLSELSKIEADRLEIDPEEVYIQDVIRSSLVSMKVFAQRGELTLAQSVPRGLPPAWGDQDRLVQILINLISNSIKFTPSKGVIIVSATLSCSESGDMILLSVSDTGSGIPESEAPTLFEKYLKGSGSKMGKLKGSGLGLYIVKKLVDVHQGDIEIASWPGVGTTVVFSIPTAKEHRFRAS